MVKILIGLLAALVIAAGAFFGFEFYVQQRAATEVEAVFAQARAAAGEEVQVDPEQEDRDRRQGGPRQHQPTKKKVQPSTT